MKDGYYWVKLKGKWVIAKRKTFNPIYIYWFIAGATLTFTEIEFDEIGDYIETPDKYKE